MITELANNIIILLISTVFVLLLGKWLSYILERPRLYIRLGEIVKDSHRNKMYQILNVKNLPICHKYFKYPGATLNNLRAELLYLGRPSYKNFRIRGIPRHKFRVIRLKWADFITESVPFRYELTDSVSLDSGDYSELILLEGSIGDDILEQYKKMQIIDGCMIFHLNLESKKSKKSYTFEIDLRKEHKILKVKTNRFKFWRKRVRMRAGILLKEIIEKSKYYLTGS